MAGTYVESLRRAVLAAATARESEADMEELADDGAFIGERLLSAEPANARDARMLTLTLRAVRAYDRGIREFAAVCEQIAVELGDDESVRRQFAAGLKAALK